MDQKFLVRNVSLTYFPPPNLATITLPTNFVMPPKKRAPPASASASASASKRPRRAAAASAYTPGAFSEETLQEDSSRNPQPAAAAPARKNPKTAVSPAGAGAGGVAPLPQPAKPCNPAKDRDARGRLKFAGHAEFRPNLTPRDMLTRGMHGGIYFHPKGGKPGVLYPRDKFPEGIPGVTADEFPSEWFDGVEERLFRSRTYSTKNNKYGVKSGLDQVGWETSGWIHPIDPRGWTQWYFRFFQGRRLTGGEDERQISRWTGVCGPKGRWKRNLLNKIVAAASQRRVEPHTLLDDHTISPVVRQTLLHWGKSTSHGAQTAITNNLTH